MLFVATSPFLSLAFALSEVQFDRVLPAVVSIVTQTNEKTHKQTHMQMQMIT